MESIKEELFNLKALVNFRQTTHKYAEPAFKEFKTQERIINFITKNLKINKERIRKSAKTGLWLDIQGKGQPKGKNFCIALRADIDALPMGENNHDLEYRSVTNAAHMCGHDAHTTCLLAGLSRILENLEKIASNKTIRVFFQPAEEIFGGASQMIKEGLLEGVDEVYGMHVLPSGYGIGEIHCIPGSNMAEATILKITIIGKGGHGSDPKLSNNPIIPATHIYLRYLELIDKYKAQGHNFNSTLPMFNSGETDNVVSDTCILQGSLRSLDEGFGKIFQIEFEKIIKEECEKFKCQYTFESIFRAPILKNDEICVKHVLKAAEQIFGKDKIFDTSEKSNALPEFGSEDFAYYTQERPGAFFELGDGSKYDLHTPDYNFNDQLIEPMSRLWLQIALNRCNDN